MKRAAKEVLFAFLLFLTTAWCIADSLLGLTLPVGKSVSVPDFVGQNEPTSVPDWMDLVSVYEYNSAPAGTVLGQEPTAGSLRKPFGENSVRVRLTVSLGPTRAEIPDLGGSDAHDATTTLRELGFTVEEIRLPGGAAGTVERTEPAAGALAEAGTTVRLFVFAGTAIRTVAVPDLSGMTRGEALLSLFRAGLAVRDEPSVSDSVGLVVVSQVPAAGSLVPSGSCVSFRLGDGDKALGNG